MKTTVISTNIDMHSTMQMISVDNVVFSLLRDTEELIHSPVIDKIKAVELKEKAKNLYKLLNSYEDFTIIFAINDVQYTKEKITRHGQIEWLENIINRLNNYEEQYKC